MRSSLMPGNREKMQNLHTTPTIIPNDVFEIVGVCMSEQLMAGCIAFLLHLSIDIILIVEIQFASYFCRSFPDP